MFYHYRQLNNALLYLILLLLVTASVYGRQASTECARKASALRDVDLMDQPPTYSAKHGWINSESVEERRERQSSLSARLGALLFPTAIAHSLFKTAFSGRTS